MSFRGGRGGRGGRGFNRPRRAAQLPYENFPEIEGLKPVEYSEEEIRKYSQFIVWSQNLQNFCQTSLYYYEDISQQRLQNVQKVDIERYSDRKLRAARVKPPLWHFISLDKDHMPAELAKGEKRVAKKVQWDIDLSKLDHFEKLEEKLEGKDKEKEDEDVDDEDVEIEEEEDFSDDDYGQGEHFDDDEDDYNMAEENDEAEY